MNKEFVKIKLGGREFFEGYIFLDAKRPMTVEILQKLNIAKLERFITTKSSKGWDEAIRESRENCEDEPVEADVQNNFNFEEIPKGNQTTRIK